MHPLRHLAPALVLAVLAACSSSTENIKKDDPVGGPQPILLGGAKGDEVVEKGYAFGKLCVWTYYKEWKDPDNPIVVERTLLRKEADLNFDGRVDIVRTFDKDGNLVVEEADLDYDGHVDQENRYEFGNLQEQILFSASGNIFMRRHYKGNSKYPYMVVRDEDEDSQSDVCEKWTEEGRIVRKGQDKNHDWQCDENEPWEDVEY